MCVIDEDRRNFVRTLREARKRGLPTKARSSEDVNKVIDRATPPNEFRSAGGFSGSGHKAAVTSLIDALVA